MSTPVTPAAGGRTEADTAEAVVAAVLACPAVVSLDAGSVARRTVTYLPGRRIEGVHVDDDRIAVSVVGVHGIPVGLLADQVRAAVAPFAAGRAVDVHLADVRPLEDAPAALPPGPPA